MCFLNRELFCREKNGLLWLRLKPALDLNIKPGTCLENVSQTSLPPPLCPLAVAIHILQPGNSSNVKVCLGFLFQLGSCSSRLRYTQTHMLYMHTHTHTLGSYLCPLYDIPHVKEDGGGEVLLIAAARPRHRTLDDRSVMKGWKS